MQINLINILGMAVAVIMLYQSVRLVRLGKESVLEFLIWTVFGGSLFVVSFSRGLGLSQFLETLDGGLRLLGLSGGIDGLFVLGFLGVLLLLLYIYTNVKANEREIEKLNQELAILEFEHRDAVTEDGRKGAQRVEVSSQDD